MLKDHVQCFWYNNICSHGMCMIVKHLCIHDFCAKIEGSWWKMVHCANISSSRVTFSSFRCNYIYWHNILTQLKFGPDIWFFYWNNFAFMHFCLKLSSYVWKVMNWVKNLVVLMNFHPFSCHCDHSGQPTSTKFGQNVDEVIPNNFC